MKKCIVKAIGVGGVLLMIIFSSAAANARVDVIVNVPLPPLVIPAPPGLIVIPGTNVYYPPDVEVDIFFYHGYWYRPYNGYWYRSQGYNGPWAAIEVGRVPRAVIGIPPGFRGGPMYERVPHGHVMKNWRRWERDRYWERRGPEGKGHEGRGHEGREHEGKGHER